VSLILFCLLLILAIRLGRESEWIRRNAEYQRLLKTTLDNIYRAYAIDPVFVEYRTATSNEYRYTLTMGLEIKKPDRFYGLDVPHKPHSGEGT